MSEIRKYISEAPVNIEAIIRCWNIELDKRADLPEGVAGEIRKKDDGGYKISINKADHYYRQRFTMAHELGHFMYHTKKMGEVGISDSVKYRSLNNSNIGDQEEMEANKFGASILMPEELVIKYSKERGAVSEGSQLNQEVVKEIAKDFQVSYQAMEFRISGLRDKIVSSQINQKTEQKCQTSKQN